MYDAKPLELAPGPRSVRDARRWVISTCHAIDRADLADGAELAISELVTNAVIHGTPPIRVELTGTADRPRFEVSDAGAVPPALSGGGRRPELDADSAAGDGDTGGAGPDLAGLATVGRGLDLVARLSHRWGVLVRNPGKPGKVVWFEPRGDLGMEPSGDQRHDVGTDIGTDVGARW